MAYQLALAEEQTIVYTAKINEAYDHVEIVRCSNSATEIIWEGEDINVWNKSDKVEIPSGKDMFVATGYQDSVIQGSWDKFDPEEEYVLPTPATGKINVYFTDPWSVSEVYIYLWKDGSNPNVENANWPGVKMTYVKLNDYGQGIFTAEVDLDLYDHMIFNSGSNQTTDISLADAYNNIGYYLDGGAIHTYEYKN